MKIAITSLGETIDSPVDPRFGRARYFLVHHTDSGTWTVHPNQQILEKGKGTCLSAAQTVIGLDVSVLITGHCGPNAFRTLTDGNVEVYQNAEGTVKKVIGEFLSGHLSKSIKPGRGGRHTGNSHKRKVLSGNENCGHGYKSRNRFHS